MISLAVLSLTLLPFAAAQNTATDLAAIKAHFTQSKIVPDLFDNFNPVAVLTVNFPGVGDITPGQTLTQAEAGGHPTVTVNADANANIGDTFTVAMVDASYVGVDDDDVTRHWLVNGATLENNVISNATATVVTTYGGPAPPEGEPAHRYVIAVYQQPSTFSAPADLSTAGVGISAFDFEEYLDDSNMGALVGATYITVQTGEANISVEPTTSVDSATLSTGSSTGGSGSGSTTGTGTGTGTNPTSTGGSSANDNTDGALAASVSKLAVVAGLLFVLA